MRGEGGAHGQIRGGCSVPQIGPNTERQKRRGRQRRRKEEERRARRGGPNNYFKVAEFDLIAEEEDEHELADVPGRQKRGEGGGDESDIALTLLVQ